METSHQHLIQHSATIFMEKNVILMQNCQYQTQEKCA